VSETIDATGRVILSHAICVHCGRPSWDHYPEGVVEAGYRCAFCGQSQADPVIEDHRGIALYIEDAREGEA
jgi:hypothetical protein